MKRGEGHTAPFAGCCWPVSLGEAERFFEWTLLAASAREGGRRERERERERERPERDREREMMYI